MWMTLVFQTRSPSPSRSGLRANSGMFYLSRLLSSNWVHEEQLITVAQLSALEKRHGEKLNLITNEERSAFVVICNFWTDLNEISNG